MTRLSCLVVIEVGALADRAERDFTVGAPKRLWVSDLTRWRHGRGVAYVGSIADVFSRVVVGSQVAADMRTRVVLGT